MPFKDPTKRHAYHRAYGTAWARKRRDERIKAGVCLTCRTPVTKFRQCVDCRLERKRHYEQVRKPKFQAVAKQCQCGRRCVRKGATRCIRCVLKHANAVRWGKVA